MAFFGITNYGYQNPIGDMMCPPPQRTSHLQNISRWDKPPGLPPISPTTRLTCTDTCSVYNQPPPYGMDIHHGSLKRYKEMLNRVQAPRSPNELYRVPLTDNQRYGWWWLSGAASTAEPWTHIPRFPRKNSEMTKFVREMSMTNREFSL
ncbi:testis-expressed protein 49 [Chanos chanos]|uniref:Testis-expressed protein 49 n=1 Tax=Chanos chanos TaxID=29144 RepID=A0A6J2UW69_CHACN|nr:testis-expressed protein 49 [Chanos chanos]